MVSVEIVALTNFFNTLYEYILMPIIVFIFVGLFFVVEYFLIKLYILLFKNFLRLIRYYVPLLLYFVMSIFENDGIFKAFISFDYKELKKMIEEQEKKDDKNTN